MKKNDIVTIDITDVTADGSGVGKYNGMAVFVPLAAVGDKIEAQILKVKKNYCFARIANIIRPSPDRVQEDCESFRQCGGCVFRHISYDAECRLKQNRVYEAIKRIGGIDLAPQPIIPAVAQSHYRNKAQYPVSKNGETGFYAKHSHRIVPCDFCNLQPEEFKSITDSFTRWIKDKNISVYDEQTHKGLVRHIYIRKAEATGEIMVTVVINGSSLPFADELIALLKTQLKDSLKSVQININTQDTNVILGQECRVLYGSKTITDILSGVKVRLSPLSFYQVNRRMAEVLYRKAAEYAQPEGKNILDLYCGAGTIGLSMAGSAKSVIGVEIIPEAVKDAEYNAKTNGIENAEFICADASTAAIQLAERGITPDVVIVDPPRKGCDQTLFKTISADFNPERIVYVSCDPSTLARDVAILTKQGYILEEYTPIDLFPRTSHVETVCLLSKLNVEHYVEVDLKLDELDLTSSESKATYEEIKNYVLKTTGLKVSSLYISQVKRKSGIIERDNYNIGDGKAKVPQCPAEKEAAIVAALKHFEMI